MTVLTAKEDLKYLSDSGYNIPTKKIYIFMEWHYAISFIHSICPIDSEYYPKIDSLKNNIESYEL